MNFLDKDGLSYFWGKIKNKFAKPSTVTPKPNGTANVGTDTGYARGDHIHPSQTSVSGNAGTATKLATARNINGVAFDGTKDITVADNTKLPLTGGTLTGPLKWGGNAALPAHSGLKYILGIDAFADGGQTKYINIGDMSVGKASTATKATQDSAGQQINTTYLKNVNVPGQIITLTKGDGTTTKVKGFTTTPNNATSNTWTKLGTFDNTVQGDGGEIWIFGGQGQNNATNQNMWAHLLIKHGYQGTNISTTNYVAATYEIFTPPSQASKYKDVKFKVFCTAVGKIDVWVYFPFNYSRAYYYPAGQYGSFTAINTQTTTEPLESAENGVLQPIAGGIIASSSNGVSIDNVIKDLSISGRTITYTKGDGTTGTLTTQDNNTWTKVSTTADGYISKLSGNSAQWLNGNGAWSTPTAANVGALATTTKGAANGVAELDANGKVPTAQLPSYVDDVLEYAAKANFPTTGETGKIYIDLSNNKTYRWSGSTYTEISPSLALGTTSSTAFRGDYGNAAYTHAVTNKGSAFSSGLYKITTNAEGHVTAAVAATKSDIGLGNVSNTADSSKTVAKANTLTTARNINGVAFDGSKDISINKLVTIDVTGQTIDWNTFSFANGYTEGIWNSKTDGGASNFTNLAVQGQACRIELKLIRFNNATDFIQIQEQLLGASKALYRRYCTNGTWTAWVKVSVNGVAVSATSAATATKATQDSDGRQINTSYLRKSGDYLNTHPENSGTIIPFMNNDIAFLAKRGGTAKVFYDGVEQTINTDSMFDASATYWNINPTGITNVVIELTLHKTFTWTNTIYVDNGSNGWRAKNIKIEVINTNYADDVWTVKLDKTNVTTGQNFVTFGHTPVGASGNGGGFNKVRFTFSSWKSATIFRIAQLGIVMYGSNGLRETSMSRGIDDQVYRSITPANNNSYNLGTSSNMWKDIYATNFHGALDGTASNASKVNNLTVQTAVPANAKFTDTTYTGTNGVTVSGTTISNSGVRSIATGTSNGTISVNTNGTSANVTVKGLAAAAYKAVDTTIASGSTSTNLPTSAAVATLVNTIKGASVTSQATNVTCTLPDNL